MHVISRFALALALLLTGPFVADAFAGSCGGKNQRPCKVFERVPSCNRGLVEDFAKGKCISKRKAKKRTNKVLKKIVPKAPPPKRLNCGKRGQRPCLVTERVPSCDGGLVEDFVKKRCLRPNETSGKEAERKVQQFARKFVNENKAVAQALTRFGQSLTTGPTAAYFKGGGFKRDVEANRVAQIVSRIDLSAVKREMKGVRSRYLPKTVMVAVVVEGGVGIGGSMELGVAFDISPQTGPAVVYRTFGINAGLITGGSASVAVGFAWMRPPKIVGELRGFGFAAGRSVFQGASVGGSIAFWFAPHPQAPGGLLIEPRKFAGIAVAVSVGATVLPVDLRGSAALTQVLRGRKWVADGCGRQNQRPCHIVERVPSCNPGLREDFIKHLCIR
ncbi:MAG: hypothetical protein RIT81_15620 [Deltaproteobacteria bacterium]